jgi:hypothetical protein
MLAQQYVWSRLTSMQKNKNRQGEKISEKARQDRKVHLSARLVDFEWFSRIYKFQMCSPTFEVASANK